MTPWDGARAQIPFARRIETQIPSGTAEAITRPFVGLTPLLVLAKISASDAGTEIDPEPASTRSDKDVRWPAWHVRPSRAHPGRAAGEPLTVPIISSVATRGPMPINLTAASRSPSAAVAIAEEVVDLYGISDATPLTITSVRPKGDNDVR